VVSVVGQKTTLPGHGSAYTEDNKTGGVRKYRRYKVLGFEGTGITELL